MHAYFVDDASFSSSSVNTGISQELVRKKGQVRFSEIYHNQKQQPTIPPPPSFIHIQQASFSHPQTQSQVSLQQETLAPATGIKVTMAETSVNEQQQNLGNGQNVHERLLEYGEKYKMKQQMAIEKSKVDARNSAAPQLSVHTSQIKRQGSSKDVAERLYNLASKQRMDRVEAEDVLSNVQHDNATGQRLFQPQISRSSERLAAGSRNSQVPIEDRLFSKGQEYQQRTKQKEKKMEIQTQLMRETSKINPISERIVMEKELFEGETAKDRLCRPIGTIKSQVLETIEKPTFQPKINKKSQEIASQSVLFAVVEGNYARASGCEDDEETNEDEEEYAQGIFNNYMDNSYAPEVGVFTLDPAATKRQDKSSAGKVSAASHGTGSVPSVYARSEHWAKQKQQRIEKERKEKDKELRQQCSFKPQIVEYSSNYQGYGVTQSGSGGDIARRQAEWAQKREQKLEIERRKKEAAEIEAHRYIAPTALRRSNVKDNASNGGTNVNSSFDSMGSNNSGNGNGSGSDGGAAPISYTAGRSQSANRSRGDRSSSSGRATTSLQQHQNSQCQSTNSTNIIIPRIGPRSAPVISTESDRQALKLNGWDVEDSYLSNRGRGIVPVPSMQQGQGGYSVNESPGASIYEFTMMDDALNDGGQQHNQRQQQQQLTLIPQEQHRQSQPPSLDFKEPVDLTTLAYGDLGDMPLHLDYDCMVQQQELHIPIATSSYSNFSDTRNGGGISSNSSFYNENNTKTSLLIPQQYEDDVDSLPPPPPPSVSYSMPSRPHPTSPKQQQQHWTQSQFATNNVGTATASGNMQPSLVLDMVAKAKAKVHNSPLRTASVNKMQSQRSYIPMTSDISNDISGSGSDICTVNREQSPVRLDREHSTYQQGLSLYGRRQQQLYTLPNDNGNNMKQNTRRMAHRDNVL